MNKIYTNKYEIKLNKKEILNDFDIYKIILINDKKYTKYSISESLLELSSDIYAIKYTNKSTECYALIKKDKLSDKDIELHIKKDIDCEVKRITIIDNTIKDIILNLILFHTMYQTKESDNLIICDSLNRIVTTKGNKTKKIITLSFEFKDGLLKYNIKTFTRLSDAMTKDKNKPKHIINGKFISRVYTKSKINEENLYINKSYGSKNMLKVFTGGSKLNQSKFYVLNDIYNLLKQSQYISSIGFEEIEMEDAQENIFKSRCDCKKFTNYTTNYCIELINKIGINIVFQDNKRKPDDILTALNNNSIENITISEKEDKNLFNLFILESNKKDEDEISDKIYMSNITSDIICQHIGADTLDTSLDTKIKTCLYNLVIKYEIKNKKIESFDWATFNIFSNSKYYKFYTYNKKGDDAYYCLFKIYNNGTFEFKKETYDFDSLAEFCNNKTFVIVDDKDNIIKIKDTEKFMFPELTLFTEELRKVELGNNLRIRYEDLNYFIQNITDERLSNIINYIYEEFPNIELLKYKDETVTIKDILDAIKKHQNTKTGISLFKNELANYYLETYSIDPKFESNWKNMSEGGVGNLLFAGIKNIHFNNEYYMVAPGKSYATAKDITNNILLRKIETEENCENFFKELLLMFINPIVHTDNLTVYPFVKKYINEIILSEI